MARNLQDYHGYQPLSDIATIAAENMELKDALEKECLKRKVINIKNKIYNIALTFNFKRVPFLFLDYFYINKSLLLSYN